MNTPDGGDANLPYPILRTRQRFYKWDVTAVYDTHVLSGTRYGWDLPITEEMCYPEGEAALRGLLRHIRSIPLSEVATIVEEAPPKPKAWANKARMPAGVTHFTLRSTKHSQISFTLSVSQAESVRTLFNAKLANSYHCYPKGIGCVTFVSLLTLFVIVFFAAVGVAATSPAAGWITLIGGGALLSVVFYFVLRPGTETLDWEPKQVDVSDPVSKQRPGNRKRTPFNSRLLGGILKAAGLAYWFVVASPLSDKWGQGLNNSTSLMYFFALAWAPAPMLIYFGYRLSQRRYEPTKRDNSQRPILFLRPFKEDASTSLQPRGLLAEISGVYARPFQKAPQDDPATMRMGLHTAVVSNSHPVRLIRMILGYGVDTSEESIVRFFERIAPVIAIGSPEEELATAGSLRMYVDDDRWKDAILTELERSQAVVIQPGTTAGVRWELEQVRSRVEPYRVLICLVSYWRNPQGYEELTAVVREALKLELPRVIPFLAHPAFVYFEAGWVPQVQELRYKNPLLWPVSADAVDLKYTLQPFVQGMDGREREAPRVTRRMKGVWKQAVVFSALLLATAIQYGSVFAVHSVGNYALLVSGDKQAAGRVARSPRITLEGVAVPYRFEVPEALVRAANEEPLVEHTRKSPDGRFTMAVIANPLQEDVSGIATTRVELFREKGIPEARLDAERTVEVNGTTWREIRIFLVAGNGMTVREVSRWTSGPGRTVGVVVTLVETRGNREVLRRLTLEIFGSFRFSGQ